MSPSINGVIERRLLVNYRADRDALARLVPDSFRVVEINEGEGIGGICLMRIRDARPDPLPSALGVTSENATHRIAVEWDEDGGTHRGVYTPCRQTSLSLAAVVSGSIVPGEQRRADFDVNERKDEYEVCVECDTEYVRIEAELSDQISGHSVFETVDDASEFFKGERVGYGPSGNEIEGLEFCFAESDWEMEPLEIREARSSFFEKLDGSSFDSAFVTHDMDHKLRAPLSAPTS
jgi:hypothetical protein